MFSLILKLQGGSGFIDFWLQQENELLIYQRGDSRTVKKVGNYLSRYFNWFNGESNIHESQRILKSALYRKVILYKGKGKPGAYRCSISGNTRLFNVVGSVYSVLFTFAVNYASQCLETCCTNACVYEIRHSVTSFQVFPR